VAHNHSGHGVQEQSLLLPENEPQPCWKFHCLVIFKKAEKKYLRRKTVARKQLHFSDDPKCINDFNITRSLKGPLHLHVIKTDVLLK
jgi:hypothetical protein